MTPYVVDANVMNSFQQERIREKPGDAVNSIELIILNDFIALDESGHCENEWVSCAGGSFPLALKDWIADMLVLQKVQLFPFIDDSMHKELSNLGLPKKDHKWIRLARGSSSPTILTDDIDLFDPHRKGCSAETAAKIKSKGSGPLSKYLKGKYKVSVIAPCNFVKVVD